MFAAPRLGEVYRQEMALSTAEDAAQVLSLEGSATVPVAGASCAGTCLVTRDFTAIEPNAAEHKFYTPGVGLILVLDPASGERVELVGFSASQRRPKPEPCGPCGRPVEVPI